MRNRAENRFLATVAIVLALASVAVLTGCQGVSAGAKQTQSGDLTLGSPSLDFGTITSGSSKTITVTVTNSGTASASISSASVSSQSFSIKGPSFPVSIDAGQSANLTVQFSPAGAGTFNGTATFMTSVSDTPLSLPLTGVGAVAIGQLSISPTTLAVGGVIVGGSGAVGATLTANGGSVTVNTITSGDTAFAISGITLPVTLVDGQSTSFTVTFTPTTTGSASSTLTTDSTASNATLTATATGTGTTIPPGQLSVSPTTLAVGSINVGSNGSATGTLTANGGAVTVNSMTSSNSAFTLSGLTLPATLSSGQSVTFNVTFSPTAAGAASSTLTFDSNSSNPTLTASATGTGVAVPGQLSISPTTIAVGNVTDGSSGTAKGTLTATGNSVTISAASTNNSAFTISGLSLPQTIAAGKSASITITFSPTTTGAQSATLTVTSNAQTSKTTATLTGTGTAAATHSVALSWTGSTSSGISGYNIYRAPYTSSCGTYAKLNSSLDANTVYTDTTVVNGNAYCYASTAVNTSNQESGYSNIVSNVQIP